MPLDTFQVPEDTRYIGYQQFVYKFKIVFSSSITQSMVPQIQQDLELAIEHIVHELPKFKAHRIRSITSNNVYIKWKIRLWVPDITFTNDEGNKLEPYKHSYTLSIFLNDDRPARNEKQPVVYAGDDSMQLDLSDDNSHKRVLIPAEIMISGGTPSISISRVDFENSLNLKRPCTSYANFQADAIRHSTPHHEVVKSKRRKLSSPVDKDLTLDASNRSNKREKHKSEKLQTGSSGQIQRGNLKQTRKRNKKSTPAPEPTAVNTDDNSATPENQSGCIIL
uniref:Uncharacterized LOC100184045 n=1 Tax=Ciona intestinalis TaxID=7719 RepID=F6U083_CIOIN|nr:uncharacterized protein LOC100184045 [Ciona intestinalis]|eukprot:XP_002127639.1 uncharacterized protein LOC100184045 [Ciona intestinalis]